MSSTSEKRSSFAAEPMRGKSVTALAGIGEKLGARLSEVGFDQLISFHGQIFLIDKNTNLYIVHSVYLF